METFHSYPQNLASSAFHMNTISASFRTKICVDLSKSRRFCASSSLKLKNIHELVKGGCCKKKAVTGDRVMVKVKVKVSDAQLKENWLTSLSCPLLHERAGQSSVNRTVTDAGSEWMIGVDPDVSGALALLKTDQLGCSAQVFDSPHLKMLVGKTVRRRLDAKCIIELLRSFDIPPGTMAYIEQSAPFPMDGKQGWWSGGFGYGLWIGILVASGFSVVPVSSLLWKNYFQLSGSRLSKDDSRKAASILFPSLSSQLTRKKDHGRAEALLIAAYGKGLVLESNPSITEHHTSELAAAEEQLLSDGSSQFNEANLQLKPHSGMSMAEPRTFARPGKGMNGQKQIFSKNIGNATEGTGLLILDCPLEWMLQISP